MNCRNEITFNMNFLAEANTLLKSLVISQHLRLKRYAGIRMHHFSVAKTLALLDVASKFNVGRNGLQYCYGIGPLDGKQRPAQPCRQCGSMAVL